MFDLFKRKPSAVEDGAAEAAAPEKKAAWTERLRAGLSKSREKLSGALAGVFSRRTLDEATLEELETALITADVGVPGAAHLLDDLKARWKATGGDGDPKAMLKAALADLLAPLESPLVVSDARPF